METNLIYCGDNLDVLAKCPDNSVDLIYADPPFFSNKHYELVWRNGAEMKAYEDRWKGGINVYVEWMEVRIAQCHRVLKDTGTMYLHCDWHANAHLRILMDKLFGAARFRNEIIWCYRGAGYPKRDFGRRHDTIFRYSKTDKYVFNLDAVREPYAEATKERFKHYIGNVRKTGDFGLQELNPLGKQPDDWWQIQPIAPSAKERLGYPTQKPLALLGKIVKASSNKGDLVLDPFCGGGTTMEAAHHLGRKWIGIDVSPIACDVSKKRLAKAGISSIQVIGAPKTIKQLKVLEPFQFQNWVISRIGGSPSKRKTSDKGVDGYTFMHRLPVQVKQSDNVGRNVVDNFQAAMRRERKTSGYIIAFSFGKGAYEEAARARTEDNLDIKLVQVDELDQHFSFSRGTAP